MRFSPARRALLNKLHKAISALYGLGALLNDLGDFLKRLLQIFLLIYGYFPGGEEALPTPRREDQDDGGRHESS